MKIIATGMNYASHNKEMQHGEVPAAPVLFMKPDTAVLKDGKPFFLPGFSNEIHYEVELVVRIDRLGRNIEERFARRYYNEVSVGIDFTARDLQRRLRAEGMPWEISKAFDGSAALGSFFSLDELGGEVQALQFELRLNGQMVQRATTADMIFSVDRIISHASSYFSLRTGDLFYTGTPSGVGPVKLGDRLEAYLEGRKALDLYVR
ncbi:MAG: fumarylacetoacetate hydrolase family protein [Tannerellaceae bacterium]|jgi:2-keto-4-pentenoate hydratase/2-oxohepta-3-ene-1,7-dioic acid hydratase in catechol pathway|nr:fumarylacetoacetate hydrolase family protein [Tannerellaceae bacterium]